MKSIDSARLSKEPRLIAVAVAAGLLIGGAGGATAVADPGSHGSTGHDHNGHAGSGSSDGGKSAGKTADKVSDTLRKTVQDATSTMRSDRKPGTHNSSGATPQTALSGSDNTTHNRSTKRKAGQPTAVEQSSQPARKPMNVIAAVPHPGTAVQLSRPAADVAASVPGSATKVPTTKVPTTKAPSPKTVASGADVVTRLQDALTSTGDPGFVSNTRNILGLFSITTAADPNDNQFIAFVVQSPLFTDVLTSGADPENNLAALGIPGNSGAGVPGKTVNTFESPLIDSRFAIPVTDPFAPLYTALVQAGF